MTSKALVSLGVAAAILLAGCDSVGKPSKTLETALDAYVAGDRAALSAVAESVEAEKAAAKALPEWDTSCAAEAVAARRTLVTAVVVDGLDEQTVMSMPELARLGNLEAVAQGRGRMDLDDMPLTPDCSKRNQIGFAQDTAEKLMMLKTVAGRAESWRETLQGKYGAEFEPRMAEANRLLRRHGYKTSDAVWGS